MARHEIEARKLDHAQLTVSLECHLGREVNTDRAIMVEAILGSSMKARQGEVGRADILTIDRTYARPNIAIYEVKSSRSDLLSDLNSDKWTRYRPFCERFYFALGADVDAADIPEGCGIIRHVPDGFERPRSPGALEAYYWREEQRPKAAARRDLPEEVWLALLFAATKRGRDPESDFLNKLRQAQHDILECMRREGATALAALASRVPAITEDMLTRERELGIAEARITNAKNRADEALRDGERRGWNMVARGLGIGDFLPPYGSPIEGNEVAAARTIIRRVAERLTMSVSGGLVESVIDKCAADLAAVAVEQAEARKRAEERAEAIGAPHGA
jgi:hypothetical protein